MRVIDCVVFVLLCVFGGSWQCLKRIDEEVQRGDEEEVAGQKKKLQGKELGNYEADNHVSQKTAFELLSSLFFF